MKRKKKAIIASIVAVFIAWICIDFFIYNFNQDKYIPDPEIWNQSVYTDAKHHMYIGPHAAVIIVDGEEILTGTMYMGYYYLDQLEPVLEDDGSFSHYQFHDRFFSGPFHFTKNDTLILRGSIESKIFPLHRFVLKRYEFDKIDWSETHLSHESIEWLKSDRSFYFPGIEEKMYW